MKVKLNAIYINEKNKDGQPLIDKNGNPYKRIVIDTDQGKASMFCGKFGQKDLDLIKTWKQGDEVEVILEKSGDYLNFSIPNKTDLLEARVKALEDKVFGEGLNF